MDKTYQLAISCPTVSRCLARSALHQTKERISLRCKEEEDEEEKAKDTKPKQSGAKKKRKILVKVPSCQCTEL